MISPCPCSFPTLINTTAHKEHTFSQSFHGRYRVGVQGAVVAGLGAAHVVQPELLQTVGMFHLAVCLPISIAAAQTKGHKMGPAVAKTLLVGGLASAQIVFATDENQVLRPSNEGRHSFPLPSLPPSLPLTSLPSLPPSTPPSLAARSPGLMHSLLRPRGARNPHSSTPTQMVWPSFGDSSPSSPAQTEDERLDERLGLSEPRFPVAGAVGQQVPYTLDPEPYTLQPEH